MVYVKVGERGEDGDLEGYFARIRLNSPFFLQFYLFYFNPGLLEEIPGHLIRITIQDRRRRADGSMSLDAFENMAEFVRIGQFQFLYFPLIVRTPAIKIDIAFPTKAGHIIENNITLVQIHAV